MPKAKDDATESSNVISDATRPAGPLAGSKSELAGISEMVERLLPDQAVRIGRLAASGATWKVRESDPEVYYGRLKVAFCCFAYELAEAGKL